MEDVAEEIGISAEIERPLHSEDCYVKDYLIYGVKCW